MKTLILLPFTLLLFLKHVYAQKLDGYANAGFSLYSSNKFQTSPGAFLGIGFYTGKISSGVSTDIYTFDSKKLKFILFSGDFRAYLAGEQESISPFIAAQPGFSFVNSKSRYFDLKGGFTFAILLGTRLKPKGKVPGAIFSVGYQNITFTEDRNTIRYGGAKLNLGISI